MNPDLDRLQPYPFEKLRILLGGITPADLPGLRSGFVAGDASVMSRFLTYRTYHGCSMSGPVQEASIAAWSDEDHVRANRAGYDAKYEAVLKTLEPVIALKVPPAGFYLWPHLPVDDQAFTRTLLEEQNVRVVPGSYLARDDEGQGNPGEGHLRLALVAPQDDCITASARIRDALAFHTHSQDHNGALQP